MRARMDNAHPTTENYIAVKKELEKAIEESRRQEGLRKSQERQKEEESAEKEEDGFWLVFEVTAYTANVESTNKTPSHPLYGITASGEMVQEGRTLSCPPEYEFGTKMYIPYFDNTYTCTDRGSAIVGQRLDVYIEDLDRALEFGRQTLDVKVLYKGE